jgi:enamine deaminase RidA (YjgF/YER057c/UK114 family)
MRKLPHRTRRTWSGSGLTRRGAIGGMASLAIAGTLKDGQHADGVAGASTRHDAERSADPQNERQAFQDEKGSVMHDLSITHVNPDGMHNNPAFSQAVTVEGNAKTIYVGGQNAVGPDGTIVGEGDLGAQVVQTLKNLETVLAAAGATRQDVMKWTIFVLQGQDLMTGFAAFQKQWGPMEKAPAISAAFVAGLANPAYLVEIEAVAVVAAKL